MTRHPTRRKGETHSQEGDIRKKEKKTPKTGFLKDSWKKAPCQKYQQILEKGIDRA